MQSERVLINEYDEVGLTPLLLAIFIGNVDEVQALLSLGADCNKPQRDDPLATPLWHAREDFGLTEIATLLEEHGATLT